MTSEDQLLLTFRDAENEECVLFCFFTLKANLFPGRKHLHRTHTHTHTHIFPSFIEAAVSQQADRSHLQMCDYSRVVSVGSSSAGETQPAR